MTRDAKPDDRQLALAPLEEKVDHVRGGPGGHLIIEYGDYECPYSRQAFHAIEHVEQQSAGTCGSRSGISRSPASTRTPSPRLNVGRGAAGPVLGHARAAVSRRRRSKTATCRVRQAARLDVAAFDRDQVGVAVVARSAGC